MSREKKLKWQDLIWWYSADYVHMIPGIIVVADLWQYVFYSFRKKACIWHETNKPPCTDAPKPNLSIHHLSLSGKSSIFSVVHLLTWVIHVHPWANDALQPPAFFWKMEKERIRTVDSFFVRGLFSFAIWHSAWSETSSSSCSGFSEATIALDVLNNHLLTDCFSGDQVVSWSLVC